MPLPRPPKAVFFDLDGTLADTAADLAAPVNAMRAERGLPALPLDRLRPYASTGARGLVHQGLGVDPASPGFEALRQDFLARYERAMCVQTTLFPGAPALLDALEARGWIWGIMSNKFERYVREIAVHLGLQDRARSVVGGDTIKPKPAPDGLLHAARVAGAEPTESVYVGDDRRDIEAGRAAGMMTVAAAYGYCGDGDPPATWGADAVVQSLDELTALLGLTADRPPRA